MEKKSISPIEARRRIDEGRAPFTLGHTYARVERATLMHDGKPETDGEHAISIAMFGTAYAMKYHPELDPYKVFFYFVMHDVDEFLFGDTPTVSATKEQFQQKDAEEAEAAQERAKILGAFASFNTLIDGLSDLDVPENAFGKTLEKLAPGYTHEDNLALVLRERFGIYSLAQLLEATQATDEKMKRYGKDFDDLLLMRQEMHRKVAEAAFSRPLWVDEPLFDL